MREGQCVRTLASLGVGVQEKLWPGIGVGNMHSHIAFIQSLKIKSELGFVERGRPVGGALAPGRRGVCLPPLVLSKNA